MATTATSIEVTQEAGPPAATPGGGSAAAAYPSDEEILGIGDGATDAAATSVTADGDSPSGAEEKDKSENTDKTEGSVTAGAKAIPKEFEQIFAAAGTGPKLKEIYQREAEYGALFPTVDEARAAIEAQRELARVDELFESTDPAAHVELMAGLAQRDPAAFRSLAATFGERLAEIDPEAYRVISADFARAALDAGRLPQQIDLLTRAAEKGDTGAIKFLAGEVAARLEALRKPEAPANAQRVAALTNSAATNPARSATRSGASAGAVAAKFVESVNADVERGVEQAVGGRVAELLPDAPDATRRKISAEIYRDLDAALKKDTALLQQVTANLTAASRSCGTGQFGDNQRTAMAALVLTKAKAVLPAVAKRVVSEWTAALMGANQARRAKQGAAASRADVGVGGAPRAVSTQPARVDYGKMSDEEILSAE